MDQWIECLLNKQEGRSSDLMNACRAEYWLCLYTASYSEESPKAPDLTSGKIRDCVSNKVVDRNQLQQSHLASGLHTYTHVFLLFPHPQ